jgi:hypothetical protein
MADASSSVVRMLRKLLNCPAKEASARSSAVAEGGPPHSRRASPEWRLQEVVTIRQDDHRLGDRDPVPGEFGQAEGLGSGLCDALDVG